MSPRDLRSRLMALIDTEIENARAGKPAAIWAKMNALVDPAIIEKLYEASGVGVERSEEHTSELQSLMRISYAVFCLKKKKIKCDTKVYHTTAEHHRRKNSNTHFYDT